MAQREGAQQHRKHPSGGGHPFFRGLLIGMVSGVALSAGVALYVSHMPSPFVAHSGQSSTAPDHPPVEMPDISRHGLMNPSPVSTDAAAPAATAVPPSPEAAPQPLQPAPTAAGSAAPPAVQAPPMKMPDNGAPSVTYFVQTGAFAKESEADNQRAHLALLGIDAAVLAPEAGDRQSLYRVRIGPVATVDEVRTLMATLKNNGLSANVIKVTSVKPKDPPVL